MLQQIGCLRTKGSGLIFSEPGILPAVIITASEMLFSSIKEKYFRGETLEGRMVNEEKIGIMGSIVGSIFSIDIESNRYGKVNMRFILKTPLSKEDIEDGYLLLAPIREKEEKSIWN